MREEEMILYHVERVDLRRADRREGAVELFRLLHRHGVEEHAQPRRGAL